MVTATVAYDGVAPSNFGSVFGYGAFHVSASATSHALVANSEAPARPDLAAAFPGLASKTRPV